MENNNCIKIVVLGAESTGKTELCQALAKHFNTVWVPEYAREYFNHSDIYNYTFDDLELIAKKQVALEKEYAAKANKLLFCDTNLITLKIWAMLEFQNCPRSIADLMLETHYDYYLITNNEVQWQFDELRQNKFSRDLIFTLNENEVIQSKEPYSIINGLNEERILNAIKSIEDFNHIISHRYNL